MALKIQTGPPAEPLRILLHGVAGIGKTTLAASIPKVIFVSAEDGGGDLGFDRIQVDSWAGVLAAVSELTREAHDYETVVFDTIDKMERLLWADLVSKQKGATTIEDVGGGFGRGYTAALAEHEKLAVALDALRARRRVNVVVIAHTVVKTFKDPEGPDYDRYMLAMNDKAGRMWTGWADCVLFANHEVRVTQRQGAKVTEKGKARDEVPDRKLYTTPRAAFDAKNRYTLPDDMPLSWEDFSAAIRWDARTAAARGKVAPAPVAAPTPNPAADAFRAAYGHATRELEWTKEAVTALIKANGAEKFSDLNEEGQRAVLAALSTMHTEAE